MSRNPTENAAPGSVRVSGQASPPPALDVRGLGRSFGPRVAVADLTFSVPQGTVFGLLGPNGAGKTTTVRMLTGQLRPDRGEARVLGLDPVKDSLRLRRLIGVMLEEGGHYDRLPVRSNLAFFARLYGTPMSRVDELLHQMDLHSRSRDPVARLSRGMRQRLALARSLVGEPRLLFLDEPTAGLDPHAARGVRRLVRGFCDSGGTVLLTTHYMEEADELCHAVGIMNEGRLVAEGPPDELCRTHLPGEVEVIRGGRRQVRPPGLEELFVHLTGRTLE